MTLTMSRSHLALQAVCYWCKTDISNDTPYRTTNTDIEPLGSVGWYVCTPACPARPEGVTVWVRQHWSDHARH